MVNAARLAPLEELLADLEGGAPAAPVATRNSSASSSALPASSTSASAQFPSSARISAPPPSGGATWQGGASSQGAATATAPARVQAAPAPRFENATPVADVREDATPSATRSESAAAAGSVSSAATDESNHDIARTAVAGEGIEESQIDSIKRSILAQEKFLGELVVHASRWEMSGGEVRLFFPMENRALAEMLQARDPMERLRNIASRILGRTVRVCVKLEDVPVTGTSSNGSSDSNGSGGSGGTKELRAKFEQDPIVRGMMERFGGQISDVKRRGEE